MKYDFLVENSIKSISFSELKPEKPYMFFVQKSNIGKDEYENGFNIEKLFAVNVTGIVTARDGLVIHNDKEKLLENILIFSDTKYSDDEIRKHFFGNKKDGKYLAGDSRGWSLSSARNKIGGNVHSNFIQKIDYRPFDTRYIYYSTNMVDWGREKYIQHILKNDNLSLVLGRQSTDEFWSNVQISNNMIDNRYHFSYKGIPSQLPLYLYPETTTQQTLDGNTERTPNLNPEIVKQIAEGLGYFFSPEKPDYNEQTEETNQLYPIDILDYIYAVLHSPSYREKYKEFLKIDFPRVPYPKNPRQFIDLVDLGSQLRQIHLLESPVVEDYITQYPEDGDNIVTKPKYEQRNFVMDENTITHNDTIEPMGRVYINETQYFENVPEVAWNFYIGGYQPAQKWLKDRKERELSYEDILHYQKIIVALSETDRIMKEIDTIEI